MKNELLKFLHQKKRKNADFLNIRVPYTENMIWLWYLRSGYAAPLRKTGSGHHCGRSLSGMSRYSALWDKNGFSRFTGVGKKIFTIPSQFFIFPYKNNN